MDDKIKKIVDGLVLSTKEKKLTWEKTDRDREYMVKLNNSNVTVDRWQSQDDETGEESDMVDVGFLNKNGELIERVIFTSHEYKDYRELVTLHDVARRNSLKVDERLDDILNEINEISKFSDEDDI